jgi:DNA-binding MarR family transcriptional regulator
LSGKNHAWTFFTNHSHVLFYIYFHPELPMRDIAGKVGITERAVHTIIRDLEEVGVITISKVGRNNRYEVNREISLRHPIESHRNISDLLDFIGIPGTGSA